MGAGTGVGTALGAKHAINQVGATMGAGAGVGTTFSDAGKPGDTIEYLYLVNVGLKRGKTKNQPSTD